MGFLELLRLFWTSTDHTSGSVDLVGAGGSGYRSEIVVSTPEQAKAAMQARAAYQLDVEAGRPGEALRVLTEIKLAADCPFFRAGEVNLGTLACCANQVVDELEVISALARGQAHAADSTPHTTEFTARISAAHTRPIAIGPVIFAPSGPGGATDE